ncbi:hypothetical protein PF008_g16201 [Phytophthora fragariae]|nr:hypothetical protein PF008_g16201 [Phytophthora fragariae]
MVGKAVHLHRHRAMVSPLSIAGRNALFALTSARVQSFAVPFNRRSPRSEKTCELSSRKQADLDADNPVHPIAPRKLAASSHTFWLAVMLTKVLYRELVAAARLLDSHASLRALVSTDLRESPFSPGSRTRLPHVEAFNRSLTRYLGGGHFYLPDSRRPPLLQLVREEFRKPQSVARDADALDTAFVALRALNKTLAEAKDLELPPTQQPEETRTVDGVQLTDNAASGVFLVAHPLLEGVFSRSVVILTEHKQEGSKGFIVNKVTEKPLGRAFQVPSRVMRAFGTSAVHRGGPVITRNAEVLHGRAEFGGQRVPTTNFPTADDPSLFVGVDLDTAARAIYDETAEQTDLVFMNGVSAWSPGQLDKELKEGSWVAVKAPVSLAINAPAELWQDLMRTLGGEYAEMSCMPPMEEEGVAV